MLYQENSTHPCNQVKTYNNIIKRSSFGVLVFKKKLAIFKDGDFMLRSHGISRICMQNYLAKLTKIFPLIQPLR